jgi:hypothetical protein
MLIGIGLVMIIITAAVVVVLRKRMAEGEEVVKDFDAGGLPVGMPDMSAQPAGTTSSMETVQTYAATTPMPDMSAQPVATQAVDDSALSALVEPEPVQAVAETVVASPEPVAAPAAEAPAEPTVVNQWTDENGHTWRVMSDGTNRWWNGTDWQKV